MKEFELQRFIKTDPYDTDIPWLPYINPNNGGGESVPVKEPIPFPAEKTVKDLRKAA